MTLLWPLLGNALLLACGAGLFVGARITARLPIPAAQYDGIIGMLHGLDARWMKELDDYYAERDAWRRGEPVYPTGAYPVVPIYGEERSDTRVEISAPTRTEQEAPTPVAPRRAAGRRRAVTGGKPSVGPK